MSLTSSRKAFNRFSLVVLFFIGGFLVFLFWNQWAYYWERFRFGDEDAEFTFSSYPGFGIQIPDHFEVHGIDVSRYQKRVNWRMVKGMKDNGLQLKFAFIKATEGSTLVDVQFKRNWRKSREAGLVRGAYHFFRESSPGGDQARFFLKQITLKPGDLPPVLDVELYTGDNLNEFVQQIAEWLNTVEQSTGVKPIIYTNAAFYNRYLMNQFDGYPLWVAHYKNRVSPGVDRNWHFWQHNENGRVSGIASFVDFNVFNGSLSDFNALLIPYPSPQRH